MMARSEPEQPSWRTENAITDDEFAAVEYLLGAFAARDLALMVVRTQGSPVEHKTYPIPGILKEFLSDLQSEQETKEFTQFLARGPKAITIMLEYVNADRQI
jgi:hypothetical protein